MLKGSAVDIIVIVIYFIAIMGFGLLFGRFTRSTRDFFFGGQRFNWWLISFSCIATLVGSYSFIKYSAAGFRYGFSSTMSYLNDWYIIPFFIIGWLPIIYFSRVVSIPEYFEKRFDKKSRIAGVVILLVYLIGYIGINLYTIGVAFNSMLGWPIMTTAIIISIVCAIYMHAGGQTSVIMTDLAQSIVLIIAGFLIFGLGLVKLGGFDIFWNGLEPGFKLPFSGFNSPDNFPAVGIFWQDALANSAAFYFMNQGVLMRFMSVKSPREGKKAIFMVILVFMPIVAFAVSNAGWVGRAMVSTGLIPDTVNPNHIFVEVANLVAVPGMFGFIMAALTAALMSTIDTLINAVSAISVNDIVREIRPEKEDGFYLKWARTVAIAAAGLGLLLVPVFMSFKSIYLAHGAFTAAVTPPMVVTILLGAFWKRFTPAAAFATLAGGSIMIIVSLFWPDIISPIDHGVSLGGYKYMRALYGILVCLAIGISTTVFTSPKKGAELAGLTIDSLDEAKRRFKKGIDPNDDEPGEKIRGIITSGDTAGVRLSERAMGLLKAKEGDIIYIADKRWWLGGLFSVTAPAGKPHQRGDEDIIISEETALSGNLEAGRRAVVEKLV